MNSVNLTRGRFTCSLVKHTKKMTNAKLRRTSRRFLRSHRRVKSVAQPENEDEIINFIVFCK